ncbi:DUF4184 family protein [Chryseolinea lacunae]|uniref:DUF4184 family protein n=1 Tax=Chryseolinea lacunae TaxID=2801331 RepID=A0ABS1KVY5_9BACT|nr:DUF4184 family protein [Chryseolinea lacunae]MBL0743483.1 DUF4184 family protein [Chryseolinea lacunae]
MPFTPAHPAVVLPFLRWRYASATGLIVGSMAPDFEYFFKMSVSGVHGHTLWGILYFDAPVSVFLALVFHNIAKRNLIRNLPAFVQPKLQALVALDFNAYLRTHIVIFLISAMVGSASHILWDGFTHNDGYFAQRLAIYKEVFVPFGGVRYPLFHVLQQVSTVVGLSIVSAYVIAKKGEEGAVYTPRLVYWLLVLLLAAAIVVLRFVLIPDRIMLGNLVVSSMSGLMLAVVLCGFINFKNTTA